MAVDKVAQREAGRVNRGEALVAVVLDAARKGITKTKSQMLREAGYSERTIDKSPGHAWNTRGFLEALRNRGITTDKIGEKLSEAMNAGVVVTHKGDAKETDAPDYQTRLRATAMLAKYTGLDVQRSQNVNINVEVETQTAVDLFGI